FKTYAMPATASFKFVDGASTIAIDRFSASGFSLGVQGEVNGVGNTQQYFAIGTSTGTLPVEIVSFIGEKKNKTIALSWQTASEINSNYFTVERSSDGVHFEVIGIVDAAGNSNSMIQYFYVDENPLEGNNYYRLKENDTDGQGTYFKTVVVNYSEGSNMVISLYPNPAVEEVTVFLRENNNQKIIICDATGKTIQEMKSNSSSLKINTSNLAEGIYYINSFNAQGVAYSEQLVVVK
ncbi:MAG: T9SS type A sorting domain-containing protein, partial [Flavobacteriales bacterium]